jgi:phosphoserine phosphatase RsbX
MRMESLISPLILDWAVAVRPAPGEDVCGDLHLVAPASDSVLLAVVDGLGHGGEAVAAAAAAIDILERHAEEPLEWLVQRCHEGLTKTRGVVMTLARLAPRREFSWLGVGNVEGALFRAGNGAPHPSEAVLLRNGLVGYQLPQLQPSTLRMAPGDLLVFATDGIAPAFASSVRPADSPRQIADAVLEAHFKGHDDALALAVRYLGQEHE